MDTAKHQKSVNIDVTRYVEHTEASSGLRADAKARWVCYPEYRNKMYKKFGWPEKRCAEEWMKILSDPRVTRDLKGPKGLEQRVCIVIHDDVTGYRQLSDTRGVEQASTNKKKISEDQLGDVMGMLHRGHRNFADDFFKPLGGEPFLNFDGTNFAESALRLGLDILKPVPKLSLKSRSALQSRVQVQVQSPEQCVACKAWAPYVVGTIEAGSLAAAPASTEEVEAARLRRSNRSRLPVG